MEPFIIAKFTSLYSTDKIESEYHFIPPVIPAISIMYTGSREMFVKRILILVHVTCVTVPPPPPPPG